MLCRDNFVIINSDRLYFDWNEGKGRSGAHHLRRSGRTDRDSELYQYQCGDHVVSEYRDFPAVYQLWHDFGHMFLHGNRIRAECRASAEQISVEERAYHEYWTGCT